MAKKYRILKRGVTPSGEPAFMVATPETFDDLEQAKAHAIEVSKSKGYHRGAQLVVRDAEGNEYFCAVDGAAVD